MYISSTVSSYWPQRGPRRSAACCSGRIWGTVCASPSPVMTPFQLHKKDKKQRKKKCVSATTGIKQHLYRLLETTAFYFPPSAVLGFVRAVQSVIAWRNDVPHCFTLHNNLVLYLCGPIENLSTCQLGMRGEWGVGIGGGESGNACVPHRMLWWCHRRIDGQLC